MSDNGEPVDLWTAIDRVQNASQEMAEGVETLSNYAVDALNYEVACKNLHPTMVRDPATLPAKDVNWIAQRLEDLAKQIKGAMEDVHAAYKREVKS